MMSRGLFDIENDAYRFLAWYADRYDLTDTLHLELYLADRSLEGAGRYTISISPTVRTRRTPNSVISMDSDPRTRNSRATAVYTPRDHVSIDLVS